MHPYLQKLINQGWLSTHKYQFLERDLWLKRLRQSNIYTKKSRYRKQKLGIVNHIKKLTSFLPKNTLFYYRIRVLRENKNASNIFCVCGRPLKPQRKGDELFYKTCGLKDSSHIKERRLIDSKARKKVWLNRTRYEKEEISLKIRKKCYNNFDKLSKEYIETHFLDTQKRLKHSSIIKFLNCGQTAPYAIVKYFGVEYNHGLCGFDPDKPATLYYIYDNLSKLYKIGITNRTLDIRFGKEFCAERINILKKDDFERGQDAYLAEQEILEAFNHKRCINNNWPDELGGKTEFFTEDILKLRC